MKLHPLQLEPIARMALLEELGQGDLTTDYHPAFSLRSGTYQIKSRQAAVLAGEEIANCLMHLVDPQMEIKWYRHAGDPIKAGETIAHLHGSVASILKVERTLLNFLQHLSGVATRTDQFAQALAGTGVQITDTRKTTPGLRLLEKKAVCDGGGHPHRYNLGSAAMIKDNHISLIREYLQGKHSADEAKAIRVIRDALPHTTRLEVEVDSLEDIPSALAGGADVILLDNFPPERVKAAIEAIAGQVIIEVSGGITLENIQHYALPGVHYISTSQVTLGAPPIDIGLDTLD